MESILTQCPRCQTSFKVSDKQLAIAEGMVRCGSCLDVFSALTNRITLKQQNSAAPPAVALEEDYEDEEEFIELKLDDDNASPQIAENIVAKPAETAASPAFDLSHTATVTHDVGQLIDADAVIPVNVASGLGASSYAIDDSGFVFDDDDIPLGDLVLDDVDMDEHEADAFEGAAYEEPATTEEFVDEDYADSDTLDEDDEETAEEGPEHNAGNAEEIAISPEPVHTSTKPDTTVNYEDALTANDDLGSVLEEAFPEVDEAIVFELDPDFIHEAMPVAGFAENAIPDEEMQPTATSTTATLGALETLPHQFNDPDVKISFTEEESAAEHAADANFHNVYDTIFPESGAPANTITAADQSQNPPANEEVLYEASAANIPPEAAAEQPQEIVAHTLGAYRDNNEGMDVPDSFTADNLPDTDEFQAPAFSALTVGELDETELSVPAAKASTQRDKEELRQYLAELEDTDALEPLPATTMDTIEAEPLTIEVGSSFRKFISTFAWVSLSLMLVAVFVLQVVANNLELMQKSPAYSRYLPFFCRVLDCPEQEPTTTGVQSFYSQDLLVRSHPSVPDALEVSFIFRNDAEVAQAFPLIELSFRDSSKRLMANRLFKPEEYLPPELAVLDLMPARSSVQVMLELADPGSEATEYEIIFRDAAQESLNTSPSPARIP